MLYRITVTVDLNNLADAIKALSIYEDTPDIQKVAPEYVSPIVRRKAGMPMAESPGGVIALAAMSPNKIYTSAEIGTILYDAGLKRSSVSPIMTALVREGRVTKVGRGRFQVGGAP